MRALVCCLYRRGCSRHCCGRHGFGRQSSWTFMWPSWFVAVIVVSLKV